MMIFKVWILSTKLGKGDSTLLFTLENTIQFSLLLQITGLPGWLHFTAFRTPACTCPKEHRNPSGLTNDLCTATWLNVDIQMQLGKWRFRASVFIFPHPPLAKGYCYPFAKILKSVFFRFKNAEHAFSTFKKQGTQNRSSVKAILESKGEEGRTQLLYRTS